MKNLLPILLIASLIGSCTKNNITFKHHWKTIEGRDVTTFDHAAFCFQEDSIGEGVIELDNTTVYDSTKFGEHAGSIVFRSRVETEVKGIWERAYCKLTDRID